VNKVVSASEYIETGFFIVLGMVALAGIVRLLVLVVN